MREINEGVVDMNLKDIDANEKFRWIVAGFFVLVIVIIGFTSQLYQLNQTIRELESRINYAVDYRTEFRTEFDDKISAMRKDIEQLEKEIESELGKELGHNNSFSQKYYGAYYFFNPSLKERVSRLERKTDELSSLIRY